MRTQIPNEAERIKCTPGSQGRIDFQCVEQAKRGQGNLRMSRGDAEEYKGISGGASPPIFPSWCPPWFCTFYKERWRRHLGSIVSNTRCRIRCARCCMFYKERWRRHPGRVVHNTLCAITCAQFCISPVASGLGVFHF